MNSAQGQPSVQREGDGSFLRAGFPPQPPSAAATPCIFIEPRSGLYAVMRLPACSSLCSGCALPVRAEGRFHRGPPVLTLGLHVVGAQQTPWEGKKEAHNTRVYPTPCHTCEDRCRSTRVCVFTCTRGHTGTHAPSKRTHVSTNTRDVEACVSVWRTHT